MKGGHALLGSRMRPEQLLRLCFCFALLIAGDALACRCLEPEPASAYKRADAVIHVKVERVTPNVGGEGNLAVVHVNRAWKKPMPEELTLLLPPACMYPMEPEHSYLLYLLPPVNGQYSTARCLGNKTEEESSKALDYLKKKGHAAPVLSSRPPPAPSSTGPSPAPSTPPSAGEPSR